jgi:hypothetical protein
MRVTYSAFWRSIHIGKNCKLRLATRTSSALDMQPNVSSKSVKKLLRSSFECEDVIG